jgi:UTP:GlnB (protein PII) uridylyltransferase
LASVLSEAECNIELVLIDTEAHRAVDVFYVTRGGRKLSEAVCKRLEQQLLEAASVGS